MEMNYEILDKKSGVKRKISFKKSKYVLCTAYSLYCSNAFSNRYVDKGFYVTINKYLSTYSF